MAVKIEVGKKYELNNGDVHKVVRMHGDDHTAVDEYGFGPFVINGVLYHQDGRVADCDLDHDLSVKRCVSDTTTTRDPELTSPYGDGNYPLSDVATKTGTLAELKVQPGDLVDWIGYEHVGHHTLDFIDGDLYVFDTPKGPFTHTHDTDEFRIISSASDTPKTWGEWQSAKGWEKDNDWLERIAPGCLEVMDTDGDKKVINRFTDLPKKDIVAYRIKPEPKHETVTIECDVNGGWSFYEDAGTHKISHRITFTTTDGKPDLDSIKMEALG